MTFLLLIAAFLSAAPQQRARTLDGGWRLFRNADNCALARSYEGGTMLRIAYYQGLNSVSVQVTDPAFKSIKPGKTYTLDVAFATGGKLNDGWNKVAATGLSIDGDPPIRGLAMKLPGDRFLKAATASAALSVFKDDVTIETLKLDRSAAAIHSLRACARQVQRANPADPFAE